MRRDKLLAGIVLAVFLIAAPASAAVTVSGSTTVMPLGERCAEEFNDAQSEIEVSVTGGGSGVGIKNIAEDISDIAMASRQVKDAEKETYGDNFVEFLIAYDAVCIAVSQEIYDAGVTELSQDDVAAIYNGEITNWEDVGSPDEEIYVLARLPGSGTRDTFNKMVMGSDEAETLGVRTYHGSNAEIKSAITGSDKAIGYLGLNYVQDDIGVIAYEDVEPSAETIEDTSYPLARALYMYTFGEPSEDAQAFLDFVMSEDGQTVAEDEGFVPAY